MNRCYYGDVPVLIAVNVGIFPLPVLLILWLADHLSRYRSLLLQFVTVVKLTAAVLSPLHTTGCRRATSP